MTGKNLSAAVDDARRLADDAGVAPRLGVVLGSGLADVVDGAALVASHDVADLRGYPPPTAPGHRGRLHFGAVGGVPAAIFQGRVHLYEGRTFAEAALPARVLCGLGVDLLWVTNAAGGLHVDWTPGDLMLVRDHLNLTGGSPLEGPNEPGGPRFPDLSDVYPRVLRDAARAAAAANGETLREGVYAALRGPQYETPAEVRMLAALGADAVGMSTVPETVYAAWAGTPVLATSVITNWAAGLRTADQPTITAEEVLTLGRRAAPRLARLMNDVAATATAAAAELRAARRR